MIFFSSRLVPRAFRCGSARQRYLNRNLNVTTSGLMHSPDPIIASTSDQWTLYDGDDAYRDYIVSGSTVTNGVSYEPGIWNTVGSSDNYSHSDHLGSLRQTSDASGDEGTRRVFTAFGERITGPSTVDRYGYVGEHGYQAHSEFPYLHVGARYYDPASGRFLQRDPIGIKGGLNVYSYVRSSPAMKIDPNGLVDQNWVPPWAEPPKDHPPDKTPPRKPESPAEELARINRRLNYAAATFATCAALTWWAPPVSAAFGAAAGVTWAGATSVHE